MQKHIKRLLVLFLSVVVLISSVGITAFAESLSPTYTYTRSGDMVTSPDVYTVEEAVVFKDKDGVALKHPNDFSVDANGDFLIADTENNRVMCFSKEGKEIWRLTELNHNGKNIALSLPYCVIHAPDGNYYISDAGPVDEAGTPKGDGRIFKLDVKFNVINIFTKPKANQLADDGISYTYAPKKFVVDAVGRIYVIADGVNQGFIQLNKNGEFQGFIGAPDVTYNPFQLLMRKFSTKKQKDRMEAFVPTEYSGADIDADGFIFCTTKTFSQPDIEQMIAAQVGRGASASSKSSVETVRKLNASGNDVLRRNGAFSPVGDILIPNLSINGSPQLKTNITRNQEVVLGFSKFVDICAMKNGMYATLDFERNRVFVYDYDSNLICAFGDGQNRKYSMPSPTAICYFNDTLYVLNLNQGSISTCKLTDYGKVLFAALEAQHNGDIDKSLELWNEVLVQNTNCELAYDAIGKAYLDNEESEEAMKYFKLSSNHEYYSQAYKIYRDEFVGKNFLWVIIGILLIIAGISFALKGMKKLGSKENVIGKITSKINYCFYTLIHPFDGFYCLKHEKRGSMLLGFIQIILLGVSSVLCSNASGYNFNYVDARYENIFFTFLTVILPYILFTISNWCLITLFDGKGTYKDIVVFTGCSTIPMAISNFIYFILSHICIADEAALMSVFITVGTVWTLFLFFTATVSIHDYTPAKALISLLCTVLGIIVIVFIILFFYDVISQMISFVKMIYSDLSVR